MPLSYAQTLGNGSQRNFDVPCEYLSKTHISVRVDGVEVPFTWVDTYRLMTSTAPALNAIVEVRRVTPREDRLVTFTDGSTLVETDLNTSTLQSFFLAQEAFDQGAASLAVTEDGQYSAQTRRISNVGDPVAPLDAINKQYHDGTFIPQMNTLLNATTAAKNGAETAKGGADTARSGAETARTDAQTARSQSQAAQAAAEAARDAAAVHRQLSENAQVNAEAARDSASGHRLNAQNAKTAAEAARDIATTKASDAAATVTAITAKANEAATSASNAAGSATAAANSANEAAGHAASVNPSLLVKKAGDTLTGILNLTSPNPNSTGLGLMTGTALRWFIGKGANEAGSNQGSYLYIDAYSDSGDNLGRLLTAYRENRNVVFEGSVTSVKGFHSQSGSIFRGGTGNFSYGAPQAALELRAPDSQTSSHVGIGFHRPGLSSFGIYHDGDGLKFGSSTGDYKMILTSGGHIWGGAYGWIHDRFADRNAQVQHGSDIAEFGAVDISYANAANDLPGPWVMTGLRVQPGTMNLWLRGRWLRNN